MLKEHVLWDLFLSRTDLGQLIGHLIFNPWDTMKLQSFLSAMAPRSKKKGKACAPAECRPVLEPALDRSTVINREGLDKVRPALAADSN